MKIFDTTFWKALVGPLVRTAISAASPYIALIIAAPLALTTWSTVGPVVLLAVLFAIATALKGLPDTSGSWWEQALQRSARQAGQFFLASVVPGVAFGSIDWKTIIGNVLITTVVTFILAAVSIVSPDATTDNSIVNSYITVNPGTVNQSTGGTEQAVADPVDDSTEEEAEPEGDPAVEDGGDDESGVEADAAKFVSSDEANGV